MPAPTIKNAREAALTTLLRVEQEGAYANLALRQVLAAHPLSAADKRLTSELVYGTVRMRNALDYLIDRLSTRPAAKLDAPIREILRLSFYQLLYMDRIPPSATVHQAVELAKRYGHKGTSGLVNGVLRGYLRQKEQHQLPDEIDIRAYLNITLSYPLWLVDYLLSLWPEADVLDFCRYHNQHQGLNLRVNTLRTSRDELQEQLAALNVAAEPGLYAPEALTVREGGGLLPGLLEKGEFLWQGEASQLIAHAIYPAPGSRVLDLCAAPGGKATHLAQLMQNSGEVVAVELHPHRTKLIEDNARRLGVGIIDTLVADGRDLPARFSAYADYVLLDAPCSGLGVLSRRADARWKKQKSDFAELATLSYELLCAAANYVKPGGYICYTTCTITEEENGNNMRRFLAEHDNFYLAPMPALADLLPRAEDKAAALAGEIQMLPQYQGLEGFYISLARRSENA